MQSKHKIIKTADGFKLDTIVHVPDKCNGKVIVMCHGLTGCKQGIVQTDSHLCDLATNLCNGGYKVVQFDWRAHGKSSGKDLDLDCNSFFTDLKTIVDVEASNLELQLWGWSIGGFAITQYLLKTKLKVNKVVLWSPVLDPTASFLFSPKSKAFYSSFVEGVKDGSYYKNKYVLWPAKNFKISKKFVDGLKRFEFLKAIACLPKQTKIILGSNDVLVDASYAENYAKEFGFECCYLQANHALIEQMPQAIKLTTNYFFN